MSRGDPRTPERRRQAIRLRRQGLSYRAIGLRLGITGPAVFGLLREDREVGGAPWLAPEDLAIGRDDAPDYAIRPSLPYPPGVDFGGDDPAADTPSCGRLPPRPLTHSPCSVSTDWQ